MTPKRKHPLGVQFLLLSDGSTLLRQHILKLKLHFALAEALLSITFAGIFAILQNEASSIEFCQEKAKENPVVKMRPCSSDQGLLNTGRFCPNY